MEIKGLNKENILKISEHKKEDTWVKDYRLKSYDYFEKMIKTYHLVLSLSLTLMILFTIRVQLTN